MKICLIDLVLTGILVRYLTKVTGTLGPADIFTGLFVICVAQVIILSVLFAIFNNDDCYGTIGTGAVIWIILSFLMSLDSFAIVIVEIVGWGILVVIAKKIGNSIRSSLSSNK